MPKKRTSPESSDDDPANKGSDSVLQQDEDSKRAKLVSLSDTTLQDLPIELIEHILIKVIVMEVKDLKLVESERKGKADPVIDRLRTVCPQWDRILTTDFFRNELNRTFDAQKTIRLEILDQYKPRSEISSLTTLKDELFVLYGQNFGLSKSCALDVFDCGDMTVVKDVIPLPKIYPVCIEACSVSNCVYVLHKTTVYMNILRITRDDEHQFSMTPLITDAFMPNPRPTLSVAADGSLIFTRRQSGRTPVISIYNMDGSVRHQMKLHSDIPHFSRIIPRPNGNLVLVSRDHERKTTLTEIDMNVTIIRQYQTSSLGAVNVFNAGMCGRMMLIDRINRIELLDSQLNFLDVTGQQLIGCIYNPDTSHFNRDRNEMVAIVYDFEKYPRYILTIFRFTEE